MKLLFILGLVVLASSVNGGVDRRAALTDTQLLQQLSTATSKFSLDLYKKFTAENKNLIISPFSVFNALAMVSLGAKGMTNDEIYQTLNIQSLGNDVHQAFHYYTSLLQGLTNVTMNVANGMFVKPGTPILPEFSNKMKTYYDAQAKEFDFTNPKGPEAPINEWVSNQTSGMIQDFLPPRSIDDNTIMWLLNAMYFKGTWKHVFNERMTYKQPFHVDSSTTVDVDMMFIHETMFNYKRLDNLHTTILELPYVGDRYSMYILLPDAIDGLANLEAGLDSISLDAAVQNMDQRDLFTLNIPKIKVDSKLKMKHALKDLGINQLFNSSAADLTGIAGQQGLVVSQIIQQAVIEINEAGTKAAAVTGIGFVGTAVMMQRRLTVNHPYMFVLRDKTAELNLFHGRYTDPRA